MSVEWHRWMRLTIVLIVGTLLVSCQNRKIFPIWSPLVSESPIYLRELAAPLKPTPHPGYGVVVGRLVTETPADLVGLSIFLADIIALDDGTYGAFLNRRSAPIAHLDLTTGWFVFERVSPGLYALVVSEPELGSWVYMQAGNVKKVEVTAGQVIELGEVPLTALR